MVALLLIIVLSYLVGSIPTSIIISRVFYGFDIRDKGSGNAGGTNAFRVLGWRVGSLVMLIDIGKGVVATYFIAQIWISDPGLELVYVRMIAGTAAVLGHIWTLFAGFRGGKGVGTAAGMVIVLYPIAAAICLGIFGGILVVFRYVSLASVTAAICLPITLLVLSRLFEFPFSPPLFFLAIAIAVLILYTHRSNISRLLQGNESRIKKIL